MSDKMETGLKICADTKRHLDEWQRRKKMAKAQRQTAEVRALREWIDNYNAVRQQED